MVAPRIAALEAAMMVKSRPVMPSRTSMMSEKQSRREFQAEGESNPRRKEAGEMMGEYLSFVEAQRREALSSLTRLTAFGLGTCVSPNFLCLDFNITSRIWEYEFARTNA